MNRYIQYMYSYPHKTAYRPLEGIFFEDYAGCLAGFGNSLYLHIPFCQSRCGYCNLFSVYGQEAAAIDRYLDAVQRQLSQYQEMLLPVDASFSDFTVGGGTPLLLSEKQLTRVFSMIRESLSLETGACLAVETAPNQTSRKKISLLREAGTSRISIGVQSFCDQELTALHRNHKAKDARRALDLLAASDFPCLNLDLIYGIPGQTQDSMLRSLREALGFCPDELFLYPLYVKPGTLLGKEMGRAPDPDFTYRQYLEASAYLVSQGYRQDSMRRFVRCQGKDYRRYADCGTQTSLALGCGGRSYLGRLHFCTPYALGQRDCLRQVRMFEETEDFSRISYGFLLSDEEQKRRFVIRHLLIRPGLSPQQYRERFGTEVLEDFPILKSWIQQGFFKRVLDEASKEYLAPTDLGMGLSDYLGPQLISSDVKKKMEEWENNYGR